MAPERAVDPRAVTHDFRQDYETLSLDDRATWEMARTSYRRQVNLCHPDRYALRPRERVHAQQRFIRLTRSYDSLKGFYRTHRRLPFEPIPPPAAPEATGVDAWDAATRPSERGPGAPNSRRARRPSEAALLEAGILNLRPDAAGEPRRRSTLARLRWPLLGAAMVLGTLAIFLLLDRGARRATLAEGREVLRRSEPSAFMPSAAEVQRRSSRGVFIEREDSGRLGDQLMEDIFR